MLGRGTQGGGRADRPRSPAARLFGRRVPDGRQPRRAGHLLGRAQEARRAAARSLPPLALARKRLRSDRFAVTADRAFARIVAACAQRDARIAPRPGSTARSRTPTRILHTARPRPFDRGVARRTRSAATLLGGLYGVSLGRAFFGESMFSRATDASKVALAHLVARLRAGGYIAARLPVHHRSSRLAGRDRDRPRRLPRVVGRGACRRCVGAPAALRRASRALAVGRFLRARLGTAAARADRRGQHRIRRRYREASSRSSWARHRRSGARRR